MGRRGGAERRAACGGREGGGRSSGSPQGRGDENDAVAADEEHRDAARLGLDDLLVRLLVHLGHRHALLDVGEDHVEVLVEGVEAAAQLAGAAQLDEDALFQGEADQIQGLVDSVRSHGGWCAVFVGLIVGRDKRRQGAGRGTASAGCEIGSESDFLKTNGNLFNEIQNIQILLNKIRIFITLKGLTV